MCIRDRVKEAAVLEGSSPQAFLAGECTSAEVKESADTQKDIPVRAVYLVSSNGTSLTAENKETIVTAKLAPVDATDQNVTWKIVDDAGIPVTFAEVVPDGLTAKVTAKSDGDVYKRQPYTLSHSPASSFSSARFFFAKENPLIWTLLYRTKPVSYTHLDVYKRQGIYCT